MTSFMSYVFLLSFCLHDCAAKQHWTRHIWGHEESSPIGKIYGQIGDAINLAQYHKWPKPVYCPKLWHQHIIKSQANSTRQEISSGEMSEVTNKSDNSSSQMWLPGGTPHMYLPWAAKNTGHFGVNSKVTKLSKSWKILPEHPLYQRTD